VVMDKKEMVIRNTLNLVELAKMLNIPIVVTEQYPKGLGKTLPEIQAALPAYLPIEKVSFNCCGEASFNEQMKRLGKKESDRHRHGDAHLRAPDEPWSHQGRVRCSSRHGRSVLAHQGELAVGSRAHSRCRRCPDQHGNGAFQLLGVAGTPEFKAISNRIK